MEPANYSEDIRTVYVAKTEVKLSNGSIQWIQVMQSDSRVHFHSPKSTTVKNLKVKLVLLTSAGEIIHGTDICPLKSIQAFSVEDKEGEYLPVNHRIKVLCCAVQKYRSTESTPRCLELTKDTS